MVGTRSVACPDCDASWSTAGARFCGHCGAGLGTTGRPPPPVRRRRRRIAPTGRRLALGVAVALVVGSVAAGGAIRPSPGDPEVSLPEPGVVPAGSPLTDEEVTVLRDQVDPTRLRCEPRGCELWRRAGVQVHQAAGLDDLLVLLEEDQLVGLDAVSGEERWVASLQDLLQVTGDGTPITSLHHGGIAPSLRVSEGGILLVTRRAVVLLDLDGTRRWSVDPPDIDVWDAALTPDRVLLSGSPPSIDDGDGDGDDQLSEGEQLYAYDRVTGRLVWWRPMLWNIWSIATTSPVVLVSDAPQHLLGVDPASGDVRWERRLDPDLWGIGFQGPWIGISAAKGTMLLDPLTGGEVTVLEGQAVSEFLAVENRFVTLLTTMSEPTERDPPWSELTALDGDGDVAWRVPFESASAWHGMVSVTAESGIVTAALQDEELVVDGRSGELLERNTVAVDDPESWYIVDVDGTRLKHTTRTLTLERDGARAEVLTADAWIVSWDPLVIGGTRGQLLGLRLVPAD